MLELLRTRRWIGFSALVVFVIAAFGFLSHWQWQRADERRSQREGIERASDGSPVVLTGSPDAAVDEWTAVRLSGTYEAAGQVLVRQRPQNASNGYWVLTPLRLTGGPLVWVSRGWMAATGPATTTPSSPAAPAGIVDVTGWWRHPETVNEASRVGLPVGMVGAVDPSVLPVASPWPGYVQLSESSPAQAGLTLVPRPVIDEGQNVSYAVQWLLFAAVAMIGWFVFLRREAREDAAIDGVTRQTTSSEARLDQVG